MENLTPAEKHYKNHLKAVSNYQKRNPEKVHKKNTRHYLKVKNENVELYNNILEQKKIYYYNNKDVNAEKRKQYYLEHKDDIKDKKKLYYINVVKPKLELKKKLLLNLNNDNIET
jgi:glucan-binding YG repeat protein